MTIDTFKETLKKNPTHLRFADTMAVIDAHYTFTPTDFTNGTLHNQAGENSGSCKLLAFAQLQGFSKEDTLACFGAYYFDEVLNDANGSGHQNIRNFMVSGFEGLRFEGIPLSAK